MGSDRREFIAVTCPTCHGERIDKGPTIPRLCPRCDGKGEVKIEYVRREQGR